MSSNRHRKFMKQKQAQARAAKAAEKRARRQDRTREGGGAEIDFEAANTVDEGPTDDEVQAAIERAMNPGKVARSAGVERGRPGGARLFVGNLAASADERDVRELFIQQGFDVTDAHMPRDRATGDPRGFAFVELGNTEMAAKAVEKLNGFEFLGRELRVNPAEGR